ncbi:uncharacterized protein LOC112591044 [Melanaphis sacchari]|uniref:uncharacterized protein LOC112591044 n=1 Tax=Melanaphis sacchari TaxID=742174 RepID=UPI000DC14317|nr:uncharacterized protein LOC112591044 [Melanaphis sacchari]
MHSKMILELDLDILIGKCYKGAALALCILFCPSLKTQDERPSEIICSIAGSVWISTYKFNISEIPDDCDIISIGQYSFDRNDGIDTYTTESDKGVLRALNKANKVVYTQLGFYINDDWPSILAPQDEEQYKKETIGPLVNFLNTFKISGLLLSVEWIYGVMENFPQKISTFISQVKQQVKHKIKFGLIIDAYAYANFNDTSSFDFTITNKVLDIYLIDFVNLNICDSEGKQDGLAPITCPSPNMTTMEQVTSAVTNSKMDKSKIYAWLQSLILMPNDQPLLFLKQITTYSTYCSIHTKNSSLWCQNPSQLSYDQGAFAKKNYQGIFIKCLDGDDFNSSCGCGQFPVTKAFISGWKSTPLTPCSKLDYEWPSEIICNIAGSAWVSTYDYNVSEIPEDCDIITIGQYAFDRDDGIDTHTTETNKGVIRALHKANKIVYTILGFTYETDWPSIFVPKDEEKYKKVTMGPLVNFLNYFKISGLLLNIRMIYDVMENFPQKISTFISQVKEQVKHKIQFGLIIDATTYTNFNNSSGFDFTITNKVLDLYLIDFAKINNFCDSEIKKYGMTPVKSPSPNITSIDQVTSAVTDSKMDISKIYAMLKCYIRIPDGQPLISYKLITSYSMYCSTHTKNSSLWCQNPSQLSYDQGAFAKKNYQGIVINVFDGDDYNSSCSCGKFPVTNAFISGWKSSSLTPCSKLD